MIVYKATNLLNGKVYIGITTKTLKHRISIHKKDAKSKQTYFYRALSKYGFENFKWEVLDTADNIEKLHELEVHYIKQYDSFDNKRKGYNTTSGGGSLYAITKEERLARSKRARGKGNPMYGTISPMAGKKFTQEHKDKIAESLKGSYREHVIGANNPAARKVRNVDTGQMFGTLTEAGKSCGKSRQNIGVACRSKGKRTAGGFRWEYID
ncbi:MAG: GIY-YIG nuclease family protein [Cellulosilyticaceae bacterium]